MASTSDEIKHMIELAQQQITHHKQEQQKWESTLQRLQKAQTSYTLEQKQHQQQVAHLETELSKACTTGPAAQIAAQSGQVSNTQQRSINTNFASAASRPYQPRPSLLSTPGQAAFSSHHQPVQVQVVVEPTKPKTKVAKVLYQYSGLPENNVMSLAAGEFLVVHSDEGDWWLCQRTTDKINGTGTQQFAPRNYLQLVEVEDDIPPPRPTTVTVVSASAPKPAYSTGTLKPGQFPTTSSNQNQYQAPASAVYVTPSPVNRQALSGNGSSFNLTPTNATTAVSRPGPPPLNTMSQVAASNPPPPPQQSNGSTGGPPPFRGSVSGPPPPPQHAISNGPPPFRGTPGPPPKPAEKRCQALFDYTSTDSSLLSFKRNDIFILQGENAGSLWWLVKNSEGSTGYVPSNHVKAL